jgi:hypothetical protein
MAPKPHRRLTDPWFLLRYALNNPKRALVYATVVAVVLGVITVSLAVDAIPQWIGVLVAGIAIGALSLEPLGRVRLLLAASEEPTGTAADGVVTVSGRAVPATDRRLSSNWQDEECLAYEHVRKRRRQDGDGGSTTSTRAKQESLPFYVDDGSGELLVDATPGTLSLDTDAEGKEGSERHYEGYVREGDGVTVYGEVVDPATTRPVSASADLPPESDRVLTSGPSYGDVLVTDKSSNGVLARQAAYAVGLLAFGGICVVAAVAMALGVYPY